MTETAALQDLATAVAHLRRAESAARDAIAAIPGRDEERVVSMSASDVQAAIRRGAHLAAIRGSA